MEFITNILDLNDDILIEIFTNTNVLDLVSIKKTCTRFQEIVTYIFPKHYKTLDLKKNMHYGIFEVPVEHDIKHDNYTLQNITKVLKYFGQHIESLAMYGKPLSTEDQNSLFYVVRDHCTPQMKTLKLIQLELKMKTIEDCAKLFKPIEKLTIDECYDEDPGVKKMLNCCENLTDLSLIRSFEAEGTFLPDLRSKLESFKIKSTRRYYPEHVYGVLKNNPSLKTVKIMGCNFIMDDSYQQVSDNLESVDTLFLSVVSPQNTITQFLDKFSKIKDLRHLDVRMNCLDACELINLIKDNKTIDSLGFSFTGITDELVNTMRSLKYIKYLKLRIGFDSLDNLAQTMGGGLVNLEEFTLIRSDSVSFENLVDFISSAMKLKTINLFDDKLIGTFTKEMLERLVHAQKRKNVKFSLNIRIDPKFVVATVKHVGQDHLDEILNVMKISAISDDEIYEIETDYCNRFTCEYESSSGTYYDFNDGDYDN